MTDESVATLIKDLKIGHEDCFQKLESVREWINKSYP